MLVPHKNDPNRKKELERQAKERQKRKEQQGSGK